MDSNISAKFKSKRKELKLSQDEVAKAIGVDQKTISHWENGINEPQLNKLRIFCNSFNIPLAYFTGETNISTEDIAYIDFYTNVYASCGKGCLMDSADKETLAIPTKLIPTKIKNGKNYSIIKIRGNSMSPEINDGDLVLIEHHNGEQIIDNAIYLFMYENEVFVKRLSKNINEVIITSDNKDYPQIILKKDELNNLYIIGKVFGFARKYF